jgi:thioredoxin reductase (NADPH)
VYLASQASRVWMLVRGSRLADSMSEYLVERLSGLPNLTVLLQTEVSALDGDHGALEAVRWRHARGDAAETRRQLRHLFLFIGAEPNTTCLAPAEVKLDPNGFVLTGCQVGPGSRAQLETSWPGVFAIGDVRAGSVKRVAAAVGEGAQVISAIHGYLVAAAMSAANATHPTSGLVMPAERGVHV